jgi:hypothetical protein
VIALWVCAGVSATSAFVSLGFSIAAVRAERIDTARYAVARSSALAVVAIVAFFVAAVGFVAAIALAMIVVQFSDAVIGARARDVIKAIGPAALAVITLGALIWMLALPG